MVLTKIAVLSAVLGVALCDADLTLPPSFLFGAATASYQVEGAWNVSDKSPSIWDTLVHNNPQAVNNCDNGDVACDSYHQWRRDVEMTAELGLNFYRFSLSWPRLLPNGFANYVSQDGARYYNDLINGLLERGVEPMITLYHWDLPQTLQDLGGWTNPLIVDWFEDYARVVFSLYGDRVKLWNTINEATVVCDLAYNVGKLAPAIKEPVYAPYLCTKHILLAHAKAYRVYDREYKPLYHGKVSIAHHLVWFEPQTPADEKLTELVREFGNGRYTHPIYSKEGGWPKAIEKVMAEVSKKEGYPRSRLPPLSASEIELIRGTYDYFAMNHYITRRVRKARAGEQPGAYLLEGVPELGAVFETDPRWPTGASPIFTIYPPGLRRQLAWIKKSYGDVQIIITENGFSTTGDKLDDGERIKFIKAFLEQVALSIKVDGVNVCGYTYWSLMDNFEWLDGFGIKFGLYQVDYSSPLRIRTPRKSAWYYASVIQTKSLSLPSFVGVNPYKRTGIDGYSNDLN